MRTRWLVAGIIVLLILFLVFLSQDISLLNKNDTSNYHEDEGAFVVEINPDTVERFSGDQSFTRKHDEFLYVKYKVPGTNNPEGVLRLDRIDGFSYDPQYSYVIIVEKVRSSLYEVPDANWYNEKLVSIEKQMPIEH
jgi:hypothetical protein